MAQNDRLQEILAKIAKLANSAADGGEDETDEEDREYDQGSEEDYPGCVIKSLPKRLLVKAAEVAAKINPVNAPALAPMAGMADGLEMPSPLELAVMVSKYWGPA